MAANEIAPPDEGGALDRNFAGRRLPHSDSADEQRVQTIRARYGVPLPLAREVAALAFGSGR
jgi:hypothetical protein